MTTKKTKAKLVWLTVISVLIANSLVMNRITPERLKNILENLQFYTNQHHAVLHPTYRTAEEKKSRAKKRAKLRRQRASK